MLIIMTSPDAVLRGGVPDPQLVKVLIQLVRLERPIDRVVGLVCGLGRGGRSRLRLRLRLL